MAGLAKDSAITLGARVIMLVLVMATSIIISRVLGPAHKGSYSLLLLIINTLLLLLVFGVGSANVYLGARNADKLPALAGNSLAAALALGALGILITWLALRVPAVAVYLQGNGIRPGWLMALVFVLPLLLLANFFQEIVRASGRIVSYNLISVISAATALAGAVLFIWIGQWGLIGALAAWLLSRLVMTAAAVLLALKTLHGRLRLDRSVWRETLRFGLQLHPGNIAQFLNYRLDVLLIGYFLAPLQVGLYVTATNLTEIIWEIPHSIRTVLLHRVAAQGDDHAHDAVTAQVTRITMTLVGAICLAACLLSAPAIRLLYGVDYLPAAPALILLMPGVWALSLGKLLAIHLAGTGRPKIGTIAALVSLAATLILDLLLIPRFGIRGAAAASAVAYIISTLVTLRVYLRVTGQSVREVTLMNRADRLRLRGWLANLRTSLPAAR
ncbi:MAG: polysaccharide biosynthesis C-terminal domain-containing protein [Caldilineaceae bacterium]|nr:polysaccharide biosynthesis C-terminal domain-containing protein [Caldilineaceae bacterium]